MATIAINHSASFTLLANQVTIIDLSGYELNTPNGTRLGFKVASDVYCNFDNEQVAVFQGFKLEPDGNYTAMDTQWYKEHVIYMVSEKDTVVTFEVVPALRWR